MIEKELSFFIHKGKYGNYIYYNYPAIDGRARGGTGQVLSDGETLDTLPKSKKNAIGRLKDIVDAFTANKSIAREHVTKSDVNNLIAEEIGRKPKSGLTVLELVMKYNEAAKSGELLTRAGTKFSDSSTTLQTRLIEKLKADKIGQIPLPKLRETDIQAFLGRLTNSYKYGNKKNGKVTKNTVATMINQLVYAISNTLKAGWHTNRITKEFSLSERGENIDYAIYYSIDELQKLFSHDFTGHFEQLRDVFVFGCFTCLRHSDYYRTDYRNAVKGNELIAGLKKGKNRVTIPLHPIAKMVLEKYGYILPKISIAQFNDNDRGIKKVAKLAGFNDNVLFTRTEGGVRIERYKEKWELTTSHTMRRSFATNALKLGMKEWVVMAIGGWKSEASFKKYKRMSEQDVKDNAMASEFYRVVLG